MAKITYREATGLDISNIIRIIEAERDDLQIPYPLINPQRLAAFVGHQLVDGKVWVAAVSGRVVGTAVCTITRNLWSELWMMETNFLVVDKHFRKHGVASNILKLVKQFATNKRLPLYVRMDTGGDAKGIRDRFMSIQGLGYLGGNFLLWPEGLPMK